MQQTIITKKTIVDRIKIAAPITMAMLTILSERLFIGPSIAILSFEWLYSIIGLFGMNTLMFAALMYNYKLLQHSCKACLNRWSLVQSSSLSISNATYQLNLIIRYCIFGINKNFKTYTCVHCNNIEHIKSKKLIFINFKK